MAALIDPRIKTLREVSGPDKPISGHMGTNSDGPTETNPKLALAVMRIIADWVITETGLGVLFVQLMKAAPSPAAEVFLSLRSFNVQTKAVEAAGNSALNKEESDILRLVTRYCTDVHKHRNDLVHGMWGYSKDHPGALLLCKSNHIIRTWAASGDTTPNKLSADETSVYTEAVLSQILAHVHISSEMIGICITDLMRSEGHPQYKPAGQRFSRLLGEEKYRKFLSPPIPAR